jgi:hypothetical protein
MLNDLEIAKNIATNGRWFCALLTLINLGSGHPAIATLAALPIGASCLVDQMQVGRLFAVATIVIYAWAIAIAALTLLNAW